MRRRRGGGQVRAKRPNGSGSLTTPGYWVDHAPDHPLARSRGQVLRHRRVLYDAIGPGAHPCHWCRAEVTWEIPWPQAGTLIADHLDGDKLNNAIENLAPSCHSCNTSVKVARGRLLALEREVEELRALAA